jgi:hypothetical protein
MVSQRSKQKPRISFCRDDHDLFSGMSEIIFASLCRHGFNNVLKPGFSGIGTDILT